MLDIMFRQFLPSPTRQSSNAISQLLMILSLLTIGCAQSEKNTDVEEVISSSLQEAINSEQDVIHTDTIFEILDPEQQQRYQPDVRLAAFWNGTSVQVYVRNSTQNLLEVEPMNFGVIINEKSYPARPGIAIASFPVATLKNQEMATGLFEFPQLGNLEGQYLYFRHPRLRASLVEIKRKPIKEQDLRR